MKIRSKAKKYGALISLGMLFFALKAQSQDEAFLNAKSSKSTDSASAEAKAPAPDSGTGSERIKVRNHFFQGFVNVLFGTGWYFVAPYDKDNDDKRCGDWEEQTADGLAGPAVCGGRSALHFDFLAGFGVLPGLEVFGMFRLGIEEPSAYTPVPRQIGAGIKVYSPKDGLFKIGFGVVPLFDFSNRRADLGYDFVLHVPVLAQFDFVRYFGAYIQAAPNISFITEFRLDITAGIGVQGRFP